VSVCPNLGILERETNLTRDQSARSDLILSEDTKADSVDAGRQERLGDRNDLPVLLLAEALEEAAAIALINVQEIRNRPDGALAVNTMLDNLEIHVRQLQEHRLALPHALYKLDGLADNKDLILLHFAVVQRHAMKVRVEQGKRPDGTRLGHLEIGHHRIRCYLFGELKVVAVRVRIVLPRHPDELFDLLLAVGVFWQLLGKLAGVGVGVGEDLDKLL
jgi:hypothetical protein